MKVSILHLGCDKIMPSKTLTGTVLTFVFAVVAYITYVVAIATKEKNWIVISALVYFLPIFVDYIETIQTTRAPTKKHFIFTIVCFFIGVIYLIILLSFLSILKENMEQEPHLISKLLLTILPAVCIPIKGYPLFTNIMQLYNRTVGGQPNKNKDIKNN